jgi:hypothetical protein
VKPGVEQNPKAGKSQRRDDHCCRTHHRQPYGPSKQTDSHSQRSIQRQSSAPCGSRGRHPMQPGEPRERHPDPARRFSRLLRVEQLVEGCRGAKLIGQGRAINLGRFSVLGRQALASLSALRGHQPSVGLGAKCAENFREVASEAPHYEVATRGPYQGPGKKQLGSAAQPRLRRGRDVGPGRFCSALNQRAFTAAAVSGQRRCALPPSLPRPDCSVSSRGLWAAWPFARLVT